ncbi:hypothetical protein [Dankookia sp. P2]|uniref:hypothetical protein n=1 Tax=Dankookia sp. P2 TaxID=3423955 RepID=UPI003D66FC78
MPIRTCCPADSSSGWRWPGALAPRPQVVLLDEAFASLDARLREQVRDDTLHVLQTAGIPAMIVTHDAEEAMFLADRIALMRGGRVVQLGRPEELYLDPARSLRCPPSSAR